MNRCNFIKATAFIIGTLAIGSFASAASSVKQPNIIWIMPDDLGYGDVSCYDAELHATPNIDGLAAEAAWSVEIGGSRWNLQLFQTRNGFVYAISSLDFINIQAKCVLQK